MESNKNAVDEAGKTITEHQCSCTTTGFDNVKNSIAGTLHNAADALGAKAAEKDVQPGLAQLGKQASERLEQSADYIQQFDCKPADVKIREFIRQSPGRSLLIAGVVGLIIGAIVRRR
jgi:ElaB/YqjD/DUF883 family membrane-anchored ribosome-binding protein